MVYEKWFMPCELSSTLFMEHGSWTMIYDVLLVFVKFKRFMEKGLNNIVINIFPITILYSKWKRLNE